MAKMRKVTIIIAAREDFFFMNLNFCPLPYKMNTNRSNVMITFIHEDKCNGSRRIYLINLHIGSLTESKLSGKMKGDDRVRIRVTRNRIKSTIDWLVHKNHMFVF